MQVEGLGWQRFDTVFNVRGAGPRPALPVRGETVWLAGIEVGVEAVAAAAAARLPLSRHRVHAVPRRDDPVIVGASEIESEDRSTVSLQSAVELMAAAHSLLPAHAEARILRRDRNLRPALVDDAIAA